MNPMEMFVHTSLPMRVVFGAGRRSDLPDELDRLGVARVMVISTPNQTNLCDAVVAAIGDRAHSSYPHAVMHVPVEVAAEAVAHVRANGIDGVVVIGGGSSVGLGKAIALETRIPLVALPTTYAGSEMTPIWGLTRGNDKTTGRDPKVLPRTVIYDSELTVTLPAKLSAGSAMNGLAHAAEAIYAPDTSPIIGLMAGEAVRAITSAIRLVVAEPSNIAARSEVLYGAWLSGACLGATTMSLHHKLCHVIGGTFNLPHASVHATVLPHVLAYNLPASPRAREILSAAVGSEDPAEAIYQLGRALGVAAPLRELGMPADGIQTVVDKATRNQYANPRPVTPDAVRRLVEHAFHGEAPSG
jgi:maleylacetate reductase